MMIKKITLLAVLLMGALSLNAQKITHAEDLKKEALDFSMGIVKADRSGDGSVTVETHEAGDIGVKITKKDGKIVRIGTKEVVGDRMHVTIFFYKKGKLIMSVYNSLVKGTKKKIANYRYFDKKGVCKSSVFQDGINGDNEVSETADNSKDAQTRLEESKKMLKLAKSSDLDGFKKLTILKF